MSISKRVDRLTVRALFLEFYDYGEKPVACGTGIVVQSSAGPLLVTARHCFTGRHHETGELLDKKHAAIPRTVRILHHLKDKPGIGFITEEKILCLDDERPLWYEHPKHKDLIDLVALPLKTCENIELFPVDVTPHRVEFSAPQNVNDDKHNSLRLSPAETVSVIGFPFKLRTGSNLAIWATGFVASEPEYDHGFGRMLIDCRAREGQSGAPVYAKREGQYMTLDDSHVVIEGFAYSFVGIYTGRINEKSDLGIVWKAKVVAELVESVAAGVTAEPPTDRKINSLT